MLVKEREVFIGRWFLSRCLGGGWRGFFIVYLYAVASVGREFLSFGEEITRVVR